MTEDNNKQQLGYQPSLTYIDDYTSELNNNITNNSINNNDEDDDYNNGLEEIENLLDNMNNLNNIINGLPNNLSNPIKEVYDQVLSFAKDELENQSVMYVPEEKEYTYDDLEYDNTDINNDEPDMSNIWDDEDFFPTTETEHTKDEIMRKEYIKNLVDLFEDYITELDNITSNFWTNFIIACGNKDINDIKIMLDNILLNSSDVIDNAKHLLDTAVKQRIITSMKLDYYNMMFNAQDTIKYLKQLKAMQELRLRYANIDKLIGNTKTNQMNNNLLEAAQLSYDKKYDIAYENLYRYLKTSNKILRNTLQSYIYEIKSKQILIERKGIK